MSRPEGLEKAIERLRADSDTGVADSETQARPGGVGGGV
jgi:hypothetical protein